MIGWNEAGNGSSEQQVAGPRLPWLGHAAAHHNNTIASYSSKVAPDVRSPHRSTVTASVSSTLVQTGRNGAAVLTSVATLSTFRT